MREEDLRPVLLVGASGRVGQLVRYHWRDHSMPKLIEQYRSRKVSEDYIVWDPLGSTNPLLDGVAKFGGFSAMICLAGVVPGPQNDLNQNRELAVSCIKAALSAGISRVLIASSSAVYGEGSGVPFLESASLEPTNDYGIAKLEMEQACESWREEGIDLCILRIGNVAGADALMTNIAKVCPEDAIDIDIFPDGRGPIRSYIGAKTLAEVLISLCQYSQRLPPIVNVGAPVPISMDALAQASEQRWRHRDPAKAKQQSIILDCSLLGSIHPFKEIDSQPYEMISQWKEAVNK